MDDVISLGVGEPDFDTPAADRRGRRREPARRPDPLHQQLRHDRAAAGARRRTSSAATASATTPTTRDPRHRRRLGGGGPRPAGDVRPGRRGDPPRAVVRGLRPGDRLRRRRGPSRRDPLRGRLRPRPGRRRGGDHAADEGALPGLPVQPDRGGPARRRPGRAGARSPSATTCSSTATRSTTGSPTASYRHRAHRARCPGCASGRS